MSLLSVLFFTFLTTSLHVHHVLAEVPTKGDRGDTATLESISSTGAKDLARLATGWERPTYGTQTWYPQGNNKGTNYVPSRTNYQSNQRQGYPRTGYPSYTVNSGYDSYQGGFVPQNRGGYIANQGSYDNSKGWSSSGSGWSGSYDQQSRPWSGGYGSGNYKGSPAVSQGWSGGQGGYGGYGDGWYGGNQVRPASGGYNWPPSGGYRGDKGYGGSYTGNSWGYGGNQGYGGNPGYGGNQGYGGGYGGGFGGQVLNKGGLGNQIYGSGYGGAYTSQKGWGSSGYGNAIPSQGSWGSGTWGSNAGYQGNYKGESSPRINTVSKQWSDTRGGYGGYPNNKGWY